MRKNTCLLSVLLGCVLLMFSACSENKRYSDNSIPYQSTSTPKKTVVSKTYTHPAALSVNSETQPLLSFGKHGNEAEYYIKDFFVLSDNSVLLVDSKTGKIFQFGNNELIKIYDLIPEEMDIHPYKIASDKNDNIYLADGKQGMIMKIDETESIRFSKFNDFPLTAVTDFYAPENNIVALSAIHPDVDDIYTYKVDISGDMAKLVGNKIHGKLINDTVYLPEHIPDEGKMIGHGLKINFYDLDGTQKPGLVYYSDKYVLGAECYEITPEGYNLRIIEMDEDETSAINIYIANIDKDSKVKSKVKVNSEELFNVKYINGILYQFIQNETGMSVSELLLSK